MKKEKAIQHLHALEEGEGLPFGASRLNPPVPGQLEAKTMHLQMVNFQLAGLDFVLIFFVGFP